MTGGLCSKTSEQGAVRGRGAGVWVLHLSLRDSGPQGTQPLPWNQHLRCEDPDPTLSPGLTCLGAPLPLPCTTEPAVSGGKEGTAWGYSGGRGGGLGLSHLSFKKGGQAPRWHRSPPGREYWVDRCHLKG